ncbi:AraC family transcriptional regulator [Paenibacillus typhae]|uniref:AraC family transcriptional regulator n=1 Tax=Paenibacillus typhae TaxID=1174501 RepID=UPI001C8E1FFF|nr:AraC family transcriptional regulator [Paenibacillus typhae]MBY0014531.1 AraC family transcriptional regulator [Paenibacillus typhae]
MDNRLLMMTAIDHIEDNLHQPLSVRSLSLFTGYSIYHFIRLFQGVTGLTPGDYIARRKITEAVRDILCEPGRSLLDISLDYSFKDYETFVRTFKRMLHTTPTQVRQKRNPVLPLLLHRLYSHDLQRWPNEHTIPPQTVDLGEIKLQGVQVTLTDDPSVISTAWKELWSRITTIPERKLPEKYYQLGQWTEDYEDNGIRFLCGCELESLNTISIVAHTPLHPYQASPILPVLTLPPARYLKFLHKGRSADISATYKYIYGVFLPKTAHQLTLPYEFEYYGKDYLGPDNPESISEIYIPLSLL